MTKESGLIERNLQTELSIDDLRRRIAERETAIDRECDGAIQHQARAFKLLIEQGNDLLLAKKKVGHGDWYAWLGKNYPKAIRTAQAYMQIATNAQRVADFEDSPSSLRAIMRALDMLPVVETEQRQLTGMELPPIFVKLAFVSDWLEKSKKEIFDWDDSRRQELKAKLKPVVDLWERL